MRSVRCRRALGSALVLTIATAGCAAPEVDRYRARIAEAQRGLEDDAAVQARLAELEAALAREAGSAPIEEFELRLGARDDPERSRRVLTRIPLPDPRTLRAERAKRAAETEASLSRLEETALERGAERCFLSTERGANLERVRLYDAYAQRQRELLTWNEESLASGVQNERAAARFEIERRVKLARSMPSVPPPGSAGPGALPAIGIQSGRLEVSPSLMRATVRELHPSVAYRDAMSDRYGALSERAGGRGRAWLDFIDFGYEFKKHRDNEAFGQIALRVPLGSTAQAEAIRFRALRRSQQREADRVVQEQSRLGLLALQEVDRFEGQTLRWQELLSVAQQAEAIAERWWRERLARPSQVAALFDQGYEARSTVLDARERAGLASCQLIAMTGRSIEQWPREQTAPLEPDAPRAEPSRGSSRSMAD